MRQPEGVGFLLRPEFYCLISQRITDRIQIEIDGDEMSFEEIRKCEK